MFTLSLRNLLAHKLRLMLTAIAIIAGVAFMAGTLVLSDTLNSTFSRIFTTAYSGISVEVRPVAPACGSDRATGDSTTLADASLDASLVNKVRSVDGVSAVVGEICIDGASILDKQGKPIGGNGPPSFGVSWIDVSQLNTHPLLQGSPPQSPTDVVIDSAAVQKGGFSIGDKVKVVVSGGAVHTFTLVGVSGFGNGASSGGATFAAFTLAEAQQLFDLPGKVTQIDTAVRNGVTDDTLRQRISAILPKNAEAITGTDASKQALQQIQQGLGFFSTFLLIFAFIALFVGSFIIVNTFTILVSQRTRELALLRALGSTRAQVLRLVLFESFMVGLIASALGLAAGYGLAAGLFALLASFGGNLPSDGLVVSQGTVLTALIVGTVVTVGAAFIPARRATRIAPVAALRDSLPDLVPLSRRRVIGGTTVLVIAVALLGLGLFGPGGDRLLMIGGGAALLFIGVGGLGPFFFPPLARMVAWPAARLRGVSGKLARENVLRNPRRTSSTAVALLIGVALISGMSVLAASFKQSISDALTSGSRATFIVTLSASGGGGSGGFSEDAANTLAKEPKLTDIGEVALGPIKISGKRRDAAALDPAVAHQVITFDALEGSYSDFADGTVMVSQSEAASNGWHAGSTVQVSFTDGATKTLRVAAIYQTNPLLGDYVMSLNDLKAHTPHVTDAVLLANNAPGVSPTDARTALDADLKAFPALQSFTQAEYLKSQSDGIDQVLSLITILLLLAVAIALIGIINTLVLSVIERTREIGLLRALGLDRRQTRRMIRWESVSICVLGALVGVAIGVALGWAFVRSLASQGFGAFAVPTSQLILYVVIAAVAGVIAAIFPARRAARMDILSAIGFE